VKITKKEIEDLIKEELDKLTEDAGGKKRSPLSMAFGQFSLVDAKQAEKEEQAIEAALMMVGTTAAAAGGVRAARAGFNKLTKAFKARKAKKIRNAINNPRNTRRPGSTDHAWKPDARPIDQFKPPTQGPGARIQDRPTLHVRPDGTRAGGSGIQANLPKGGGSGRPFPMEPVNPHAATGPGLARHVRDPNTLVHGKNTTLTTGTPKELLALGAVPIIDKSRPDDSGVSQRPAARGEVEFDWESVKEKQKDALRAISKKPKPERRDISDIPFAVRATAWLMGKILSARDSARD
jgi:hypothetical protein